MIIPTIVREIPVLIGSESSKNWREKSYLKKIHFIQSIFLASVEEKCNIFVFFIFSESLESNFGGVVSFDFQVWVQGFDELAEDQARGEEAPEGLGAFLLGSSHARNRADPGHDFFLKIFV